MTSKMKVKYPIGIQWKIAKNELQKLRSSIDGYLDSDRFDIPGTDVEYCISISPNGDRQKRRGETRIFLYLENEGKKEIEAEVSISIDSAKYSRKYNYVYKKSEGWGNSLCTVEELFDPVKRFIVDGEMVIKMEGFAMIEMDDPTKFCILGKNENNLGIDLWNQQNKDFTIIADGKEVTAHKNVLAARSPVFEAMFQPHTQEAQENKVVIPDFSFDVVEAAIKLCYDTSLVDNVSFEDQISLLQFFDKYDIQLLKNHLEQHLISQVNETNVCRLAKCSIAPKLQKHCGKFLIDCIRNAKPVIDFDILDKDFVVELFKNSLINFSV